jgi:serine-type D-Ala-D-Ala carboxypeptidase (penicillin-binding protein 5/6)
MLLRLSLLSLLTALASPQRVVAATPMPAAPVIEARNWILIDFASGQSLAESLPDQRIEPASLTKLMSAYVVFNALRDGRLKLDEQVLIRLAHLCAGGHAGAGRSAAEGHDRAIGQRCHHRARRAGWRQ